MGELRLETVGLADREAVIDVVFVHGLGGDHQTTWQVDGDASTFWPLWIFEDVQEARVWSLQYPANALRWTGSGNDMALPDRAKAILDLLVANSIGSRPVVFVAHSLGGLVVKQILRLAHEFNQPAWEELGANTRGVIFLATPHHGAALASFAKAIHLLGPSVSSVQITSNDPHLRDLSDWYQQNATKRGVRTHAYYETMPLGPLLVVNPTSANPGVAGCVAIPCDCDHQSICKPTSRTSPVYAGVRSFIEDAAGRSHPIHAIPTTSGPTLPTLQDEFDFLTTSVDEDARLDLAEKLKRGDREIDIPRAIRLKEQFAKQFTRNTLQFSATRRYVHILADVESRFNAHVYPEIIAGASKAKIADLIREKITDPVLSGRTDDDSLNAVVIDRMIFFLTGVCHIKWAP